MIKFADKALSDFTAYLADTYFVDETTVWQSVPDRDVAWHCGAKSYKHPVCRNTNSIGIEICMLDKRGNIR